MPLTLNCLGEQLLNLGYHKLMSKLLTNKIFFFEDLTKKTKSVGIQLLAEDDWVYIMREHLDRMPNNSLPVAGVIQWDVGRPMRR